MNANVCEICGSASRSKYGFCEGCGARWRLHAAAQSPALAPPSHQESPYARLPAEMNSSVLINVKPKLVWLAVLLALVSGPQSEPRWERWAGLSGWAGFCGRNTRNGRSSSSPLLSPLSRVQFSNAMSVIARIAPTAKPRPSNSIHRCWAQLGLVARSNHVSGENPRARSQHHNESVLLKQTRPKSREATAAVAPIVTTQGPQQSCAAALPFFDGPP